MFNTMTTILIATC